MAATSQTTFSNATSWMKMRVFRLRFHWSLFLRIQLTIFHHWLRWWLGAVQATSHYLNQWWLVHWRIYASLGLNELRHKRSFRGPPFNDRDVDNYAICSHTLRHHRNLLSHPSTTLKHIYESCKHMRLKIGNRIFYRLLMLLGSSHTSA